MKLVSSLLFAATFLVPTIAMGDTKSEAGKSLPLSIHMEWGIGDLGTTIDLRYEAENPSNGTMEAAEYAGDGYLLLQGTIKLDEHDIDRLLMAKSKFNIAELAPELPPATAKSASNKTVPDVLI